MREEGEGSKRMEKKNIEKEGARRREREKQIEKGKRIREKLGEKKEI